MISSFKPIINKECKILILGSIPGEESLRKQQYYGYPRNHFWKIMFTIFNTEFTDDYDEKTTFLLKNNIALWDVIQNCEREGSLDSNIKNPIPNDINGLLLKYPNIKLICFNGKKAEESFKRYVQKGLERKDIKTISLPSTSPANTMKFEDKLKIWIETIQVEVQK